MSMISQTLQGAVLSATSNILAQAISSYKDSTPFALNPAPVFKFVLFSILSNPPNILWQGLLEDLFPTTVPAPSPPKDETKSSRKTVTSNTNIAIKFFLDQTIGALVNTLMFIAYIGYTNAMENGWSNEKAWTIIQQDCWAKTWPMMKDGYKFWPAISLVNFVWVPVEKRVVVGCAAGVLWGIYLSLLVEG